MLALRTHSNKLLLGNPEHLNTQPLHLCIESMMRLVLVINVHKLSSFFSKCIRLCAIVPEGVDTLKWGGFQQLVQLVHQWRLLHLSSIYYLNVNVIFGYLIISILLGWGWGTFFMGFWGFLRGFLGVEGFNTVLWHVCRFFYNFTNEQLFFLC